MTRLVQVLGALIGAIVALQLALSNSAGGLLPISVPGGLTLVVWIIAWTVLGFLILPQLTVVPALGLLAAVRRLSLGEFVMAIAGLLLGLVIGLLLGLPLGNLPAPTGQFAPFVLSVLLGLSMMSLTLAKRHDLLTALEAAGVIPRAHRDTSSEGPEGTLPNAPVDAAAQPIIVVDTSAIIDGRIADVVASGFLFGTLVVPQFVLVELQHIADHPDAERRNRGRRGLEILATLQKDGRIPLEISQRDFPTIAEVDLKLVALARERGAAILTTDFNLNRVAEVSGLRVLNINALANAVRPAFLPGEKLRVKVTQGGKEPGQGLAFLEDGTMIVIEGGERYRDREVEVTVTRVLQSSAGKMVFAQPRPE
jgi:uncharacterized protein YacL